MDQHTLFIALHGLAVVLLLIIILLRGTTLFKRVEDNQPNQNKRKVYVAIQHASLTLLVFSGLALLYMKHFQVEHWFYAKIILFLVLLSSLIKTYKKDDSVLLSQRRAGLVLSVVAFVAILSLVMIKPVFG
ncbi:SirB2 family protein [Acinetobacter stercoris]|uniref:Invasion gene expression up-regulator, SirB n=1 Tax=Acinetobacter stercoris TaxID=2126983 RepID=A0A2U3MVW0_9GAMM|nr:MULTISPECIES: SirB2 family protein [Acinetobacter]SPL69439.1 Invasion gene expression up-regulator, SirB [Acinetobacter stercoris]